MSVSERAEWDLFFLFQAASWATRSKDPSSKIGAIIVNPRRHVISTGYNGFPSNIADDPELYANRPEKYRRIIHGEMNAILKAKCDIEGHTLYVWPFSPCEVCAPKIIQSGIARVVAPTMTEDQKSRWASSCEFAESLFKEAGVAFDLFDKSECVASFKKQFGVLISIQ